MNAQYFTVDGSQIRYVDNGNSGPVLLLLHGVGGSLELWDELMNHPDNAFRIIAMDFPGHGLSSFLDDKNYRLDLHAQRAWQLLDNLGVKNVTLVGNSLGGAVSLRMLQQQEPRVDKLVLLNAATIGKEAPMPFRLMTIPFLGEIMTKSVDMAFKQQIEAIFDKSYVISDKLREVIKRNVSREGAQAAFLAHIRNVTSLTGLAKHLVDESLQIVSTTKKPILYIHGRQDTVIPMKHSESAHALTANSKLIIMENCGHSPHVEKVQELMGALKAF